ncbi:MAG: hypothetical protein VXX36_10120 [Verrucomicrobiota bacterium]|nr:hypothetical protein [Verrucomicrobiota bacterium]
MIRLLFLSSLAVTGLSLTACANKAIQMGGLPEWMLDGAKIGYEPAPIAPDPALLDFKSESGQIEFSMITDARDYPLAPPKKVEKTKEVDYERGRDRRIKRLFY